MADRTIPYDMATISKRIDLGRFTITVTFDDFDDAEVFYAEIKSRSIVARQAPHDAHNSGILPLLRMITDAAHGETDQWILLETLCLGIGKLHGRNARQSAEFIELMAERIATGERV